MSWLRDAQSALSGSWRLLLRDLGGFDDFDLTLRGFWRSFAAIVLLAPFYLYADLVQSQMEMPDGGQPQPFAPVPVLFTLGLQWVAWPLAMAFFCRATGLTHHYARYITVYNWSSILVMVAMLAPLLLFSLGGAAESFGALVYLIVLIGTLYYRWFIAVSALETGWAVGWALVLADFVISISITRLIL